MVFFYVQLTAPLSWYPPSELEITNVEKLRFLGSEGESLLSLELLGGSNSPGDTIAARPSKSAEALSLYNRGEYDSALKLFRQIEAEQGKEKSTTAQVRAAEALVNIGVTLTSMGRYKEAQEALEDALSMHEKIYGVEHPATVVVLNNLGATYKNLGEYGKALEIYKRVLEIQEKTLGPAHPDAAASLNNLASIYATSGRYGEAEPLFLKSLELNEKLLGKDHPQTLASLNNLAYLYQSLGRYDEALPIYKRSLEASERVLGPEHPTAKLIQQNIDRLKNE